MLKTVVLLAAFMVNFLGGSLGYSAGIIHLGLLKKFPEFSSEVAWAGSLFTSVFCLAGPISSAVINTLSCRSALFIGSLLSFAGFLISSFAPRIEIILLCYGIVAGIGQSMVYSASVVVVGYYFHENPSVATGVVVSGTGVGVTVFPIFTEFLLTTYGIDGAFLLLSAVSLQSCVFIMCIRTHHLERRGGERSHTLSWRIKMIAEDVYGIFLNRAFCFLCISILCWSTSLNTSVLFLPQYYISTGSSQWQAAFLMSLYGIMNCLSRTITGLAASDPNVDGKILYMGSYFILGLCTSFLPLTGASFAGKIFYSIILGLYSSGVWSLLTTISVEIVGLKHMSTAFGIEMLTSGVGFLFGPIIGDSVKTQSRGYTHVFVISGVFYAMAAVFEGLMILTMSKADVHHSQQMAMRSIETDVMIGNSEREAINNDNELDDDHRKNIEIDRER
ncbi:monocarboxylate transporter 12-like isoform X3 [Ostrea edulis]|uniref:monocarboxylate transporter 12-like isoform X3 n=1 Tax=Ostrea edulis TaxID=37623 RepID=UPI0024AEAB92|nr:monocarboxylate transporter 12-like isoform X3 [Ostrea edulis]XP_056004936.1 monocarboxylate transporter 12-like isoform X3 [Ostrea edulis]XP_056004937.1 monocarboxylate transporter 12-like isoform X3 [Ostrea edulis]XP_056004938.1 monocarboxylate transporter 12-like isoform X3 [Ostrea edulis]